MESEKLLPCPNPWCDCPDELVIEPIVGTGAYGIECGCGFNGPALGTPELAIAAWNTRAPADLRSALEAETIERAARAMCVHDGLDPDEHIIGGQASGFEDYGPLWQAEQRSEGQLGITDYAGLARAALAPTKGDVS